MSAIREHDFVADSLEFPRVPSLAISRETRATGAETARPSRHELVGSSDCRRGQRSELEVGCEGVVRSADSFDHWLTRRRRAEFRA